VPNTQNKIQFVKKILAQNSFCIHIKQIIEITVSIAKNIVKKVVNLSMLFVF